MKFLKFAVLAAVGLLTLPSCTEDQSTFDVKNIPGRCLIEGVVKYNEGTTLENGHFTYNYKPAAQLEITVTISNSEYGDLEGQSTFKTVTDSEGKYSIEIPAPANNASVRITTADFRGVRSVISEQDNKIVSGTEDVIYRGVTNATIHSQGIVYANIVCAECSVDRPIVGMTQLATIKGKIGQGVEYKVPAQKRYNSNDVFVGYSDAQIYYVYEGAKADLIVNVDYNGITFTYNVSSDASGEWSLQVPVYSFPASFSYSLKAMPYNSQYTHYVAEEATYTMPGYDYDERTYTDYIGKTIQGYYSQSFNATYNASFPVAAEVCSSESKIMLFNPLNNGQDIFGYSSTAYSSNGLWRSELLENLSKQ